jgi:hypothetical protein
MLCHVDFFTCQLAQLKRRLSDTFGVANQCENTAVVAGIGRMVKQCDTGYTFTGFHQRANNLLITAFAKIGNAFYNLCHCHPSFRGSGSRQTG